MYLPEDVFAIFKGNTFHEDARCRTPVEVVADEDETFATPNDAGSFSDPWDRHVWKLKLLDEVGELNPPVFFNHQYFSDCGQGLCVSTLLALYLD